MFCKENVNNRQLKTETLSPMMVEEVRFNEYFQNLPGGKNILAPCSIKFRLIN